MDLFLLLTSKLAKFHQNRGWVGKKVYQLAWNYPKANFENFFRSLKEDSTAYTPGGGGPPRGGIGGIMGGGPPGLGPPGGAPLGPGGGPGRGPLGGPPGC